MALRTQIVDVVFDGLDQASSDRSKVPAKLEQLRNVHIDRKGRIKSRRGFTVQTTDGPLAIGAEKDGALSMLFHATAQTSQTERRASADNDQRIRGRGPSAQPDASIRVAACDGFVSGRESALGVISVSAAVAESGIGVVVSVRSDGAQSATWADFTTGEILVPAQTYFGFSSSKQLAVSCGDYVVILIPYSPNNVEVQVYNAATVDDLMSTSGFTVYSDITITDMHADRIYDVFSRGTDTLYLAYKDTSGNCKVIRYSVPSMAASTYTDTSATDFRALAWLDDETSTNAPLLATADGTNGIRVNRVPTSGTPTYAASSAYLARTAVHSITGKRTADDAAKIYWTELGASVTEDIVYHASVASFFTWTFSSSTDVIATGASLASHYAAPMDCPLVLRQDQADGGYYWGRRLTQYYPGSAAQRLPQGYLPRVDENQSGSSRPCGLVPVIDSGVLAPDESLRFATPRALRLYRGTADYARITGPPVEFAGMLWWPGAVPWMSTKSGVFQTAGCPSGPLMSTPTQTTGGSLTALGTYLVSVVAEWYQGGRVWRSAPAVLQTVTLTGSNNRIDVTVRGSFAATDELVQYRIYRSVNSGTILYSDEATYAPGATNITLSDASVQDNAVIYTTGAEAQELPNFPCPPCTFMAASADRLWVINAEQGQVSPSKLERQGEGIGWNPLLDISVPTDGGKLVALAYQDGRMLIFAERAIYAIDASGGPDNLGRGAWGQVQTISVGIGCTCPRSVIVTHLGTWFRSSIGLCMVDRGLAVQEAGAPVHEIVRASGACVGAHHFPDRGEIVWEWASGTEMRTRYNYRFGVWSSDFSSLSTVDSVYVVSSASWAGGYSWLGSNGSIYTEVTTEGVQLFDGARAQDSWLQTGWITLAGITGYQRVLSIQINADIQDTRYFGLEVYYDYETSYDYYQVQGSSSRGDVYEVRLERQLATAIKIGISPMNGGYPRTIYGISLRVGIKSGREPTEDGNLATQY